MQPNLAFLALFINALIAAKALSMVRRTRPAWALAALTMTLAARSLAELGPGLGLRGQGLGLSALLLAYLFCSWVGLKPATVVQRGPWLMIIPLVSLVAASMEAFYPFLPQQNPVRTFPPPDAPPWYFLLGLSALAALPGIQDFRRDEWVQYRCLLPPLLALAWISRSSFLPFTLPPSLALEAWCELCVLVMARTILRNESFGRLPMFLAMMVVPSLAGAWVAMKLASLTATSPLFLAIAGATAAGILAATLAVLLREEVEHRVRQLVSPTLEEAQERSRQLENELLAARDALRHAEREALVGEVVLSVAHQIKNPLGPMKGYAQMLASDAEQVEPAERRDRMNKGLRIILAEIDRIDREVRALMTYAGRTPSRRDPVDINRLLERAVLFVAPGRRGVTVRLDLAPGLPPILGDADRLHEAILNLVLNAVEAMADRPIQELTVTTGRENEELAFRISDTGRGIHPEDMDRIFEPFYSRRQGGFGLGLPIARSAITECGGRLTCRSTLGVGTEFFAWLPIPAPGDPSPASNKKKALPAEEKKVIKEG